MASEIPEYFLTRNWDYPPKGPIKLGNVLTSIKEPHRPLATVRPDADAVITSSKSRVAMETGQVRSGGVTIMTTFLSALLGAGMDVGVDAHKSTSRTFDFDRLDTSYISTTDEDNTAANKTSYQAYMERCVQAPTVRRYLERKRFRKHVYVITGLKVVNGVKSSTTASHATDTLVGAQLDGSLLSGGAVPVGGGAEVHGGTTRNVNISWEGSTEFVFAFKVSKVRVRQAGNVKEEEYLKGAFLENTIEIKEPAQLTIAIAQRPIIEVGNAAFSVADGEETIVFGVLEEEGDDD